MKLTSTGVRASAALCALVALFELPRVWLPEPPGSTGELWVLITGALACQRLPARARRVALWALGAIAAMLLLVRLDRAGFHRFMGDEPLLYDQLFMARHLFVLMSDVWSWQVAATLAVIVTTCTLSIAALPRLLQAIAGALQRRSAWAIVAPLVVALLGSYLPAPDRPVVRWMTPRLLDNLVHSHQLYARVQGAVGRSRYRSFAGLSLPERPDVYLIFVESYGRLLADNPRLRGPHLAQLRRVQQQLMAAGWHAVSGYSRAPVLGGRSWLAEASVLMGLHVAYEAVFRQLLEQIDAVPNIIGFLKHHGYHTISLAPADRRRPGVEEVNYYGYERSVHFDDLDYHGPRHGWGIVPDQYSLGYASEHVIAHTPHPRFVDYHMVSSHAPWRQLPALVDDWRTLNAGKPLGPLGIDDSIESRMRRYVDKRVRIPYEGRLNQSLGARYATSIAYDIDVLARHLAKLHDPALVIIMGDHQPPFLAAETQQFDTPVHILSRDPRLLDAWSRAGFAPGLLPPDPSVQSLRHEDLFPLLVRSLTQCCQDARRPSVADMGG